MKKEANINISLFYFIYKKLSLFFFRFVLFGISLWSFFTWLGN